MSDNDAIDGSLLYQDDEKRGRETDVESGMAADEARDAESTLRTSTQSTVSSTTVDESQGAKAPENQSCNYKCGEASNVKMDEDIEQEADQPCTFKHDKSSDERDWDDGVEEQGTDASLKDEETTKDDTTIDVETGGESGVASLHSEVAPASTSVEATPSDGSPPHRNKAATPTPPGAVRILPPGGNPLADWEGSDDEGTRGDNQEDVTASANIPEAKAEYVDHAEEERRMEERVTKKVQDQMIRDAPIADVVTPLEHDGNTRKNAGRRRVVLGGIALALFATAVGASLGVILPKKRSSEPSEDAGTVEPTAAPTALPLDELLSSVSFDGGKALRTPSTPQNMAYEWLASNTNLDTFTNGRRIQRYTLATLYFSTNGPDWDENRLDNGHECEYSFVQCTSDGEVLELALNDNNLVGSLPPEIALLSNSLAAIVLSFNSISGSIPSEMRFLTALTRLQLDRNELSGPIPTEVGLLTAMEELLLSDNRLSGSIPIEIGSLTTMRKLTLWDNELSGTIPTEVGSLTSMTSLTLQGNELSGSIPTKIGSLSAMSHLSLYENQLTGPIPTEIGSLTAMKYLYLNSNKLIGSIPAEIGGLTAMEYLELHDNILTGSIPSELGYLTKLGRLELMSNELSGSIPTEIGLTAMYWLRLENNTLTGTIPSEIMDLTAMRWLDLHANQLTGTIPSVFHNMAELCEDPFCTATLDLSSNQLTGAIPSFFHNVTNLVSLHLYDNEFTGSFTCPDFVKRCWISCDPDDFESEIEADFFYQNDTCRSL